MKNFIRVIAILFLLLAGLVSVPFILSFISPGDDPWYKGPYINLNCVVMNSILGFFGDNNAIIVLEEDSFGRQMFINWCNTVTASKKLNDDGPPAIYSILISQKTEDENVYFYPDYNFVIYKDNRETRFRPKDEDLINYARDYAIADDIEWLKQKNDWEKPIDENKCVSVHVSRKNRAQESRTPLLTDEAAKMAYEQVDALLEYFPRTFFAYLTSDQYDRHLYFFRVLNEYGVYTKSYVIIFNKDGFFDIDQGIMEITDVWHYQDELKAFKERNGWNT